MNEVPALQYYKSAMMYRNSKGVEDKRISAGQWEALYTHVKRKIQHKIEMNGFFEHPGKVSGFRIIA